MSLSKPQQGVAVGAASAAIITAVALGAAALLAVAQAPALGPRLHLLALSGMGPAVALAASIGRLANHRFSTPEDLDGNGLTIGTPRAKLLQALLQNTLEQVVLACPAYAVCALLGPVRLLSMVPVASVLFIVGRALFFWGYARGAAGRALGFGLTFYPTLILLACALVTAIIYAGN